MVLCRASVGVKVGRVVGRSISFSSFVEYTYVLTWPVALEQRAEIFIVS